MHDSQSSEKIVLSACNVNCGNRCPLRVHVQDGQVVRAESDNTGDRTFGTHEIRVCLRGRGLRKLVYSPDRFAQVFYPDNFP